jgi:glycosyltransferase involved in cell wall biosynthesis
MSSVNAVIITYNHQDYIEKAIQGAVEQEFNGAYKIIIHDDCSTDATPKICSEYKNKYPGLIDLHIAVKNKGMNKSWADALSSSQAKYNAICEGDDYWTNANKLQKQVSFLESNPEYAICCHRVSKQKEGKKPKPDNKDIYAPLTEATYDIEMMAKEGNLVATPSAVYRNGLFSSFPSWFYQSPVADYVLHMFNAQYGKIKYLPDNMAVYREHSQGAWGGKTVKENTAGMIKVLELLLTEPFTTSVKKGLNDQLRKTKATYLYTLMQEDKEGFQKEIGKLTGEDKSSVLELVEKQKKASQRSIVDKLVDKLRKI